MSGQNKRLLAVLLALGVGLVLALWALVPDGPGGGRALEGGGAASVGAPGPASTAGDERLGQGLPEATPRDGFGPAIEEPLRVELELVRALDELVGPSAPALGSGAKARLRGAIYRADGGGARAEVRFVHGANAGRVLSSDAEGAFGANDLYPGLSIVEVTGSGLPGSLREVRLRRERETILRIGYGRPAVVYGEVVDRDGDPLEGATVTMDGHEARTDPEGVFVFPRMTSGRVLTVVEKPGYAGYREEVGIQAGATVPIGRLKFQLLPGASLEVSVVERVGAGGQAQVFLLPTQAGLGLQRTFPWWRVSPTPVYPGGTVRIEDLPEGSVRVLVFHAGAVTRPRLQRVELQADVVRSAVVHLEPAPRLTGVVTIDGRPANRALVRLEAPDRGRATARILGEPEGFLEGAVLPSVPPAVQMTYTRSDGRFDLSAAEELGVRYLTAEGADGRTWAGRVISGELREVDLALEPRREGSARLVLETSVRERWLPAEVRVEGTPREPLVLAPDARLEIDRLVPGSWKLSVRWDGEWLFREQPLELPRDEATELFVALPEEALGSAEAPPVAGEPSTPR